MKAVDIDTCTHTRTYTHTHTHTHTHTQNADNYIHNILRLLDSWADFLFTTGEMKHYY